MGEHPRHINTVSGNPKNCLFCLPIFLSLMLAVGYSQCALASPSSDSADFKEKRTIQYSTENSPKAKGVLLQARYPASWKSSEGDRPNIVRKFMTEYKDHLIWSAITIINVPGAPAFTVADVNDEKMRRSLVKEQEGEYLYGGATQIEGEQAFWVIFRRDYQVVMATARMLTIVFNVMLDERLIQISFAVGGSADDPQLDSIFAEYLPVFQMIVTTIILPDKWTIAKAASITAQADALTEGVKWAHIGHGPKKGSELLYAPKETTAVSRDIYSALVMTMYDKNSAPEYSHVLEEWEVNCKLSRLRIVDVAPVDIRGAAILLTDELTAKLEGLRANPNKGWADVPPDSVAGKVIETICTGLSSAQ